MKTKLCTNQPQWSAVTVQSKLPAGLEKMQEIAHNYWWTWNTDVTDLLATDDRTIVFRLKKPFPLMPDA